MQSKNGAFLHMFKFFFYAHFADIFANNLVMLLVNEVGSRLDSIVSFFIWCCSFNDDCQEFGLFLFILLSLKAALDMQKVCPKSFRA